MSVRIIREQWGLFDGLKPKLIRVKVSFRVTPKGRDVVFKTIADYELFKRVYQKELLSKEKEVKK